MKLATLRNGARDGQLVVVARDLTRAANVAPIARTLQEALEHWEAVAPALARVSDSLNAGKVADSFSFEQTQAAAPLPRAYQWCDGSAFLHHGRLMEQAYKSPPMADYETVPLMYQGASDDFLGPREDAPLPSEEHGIDFEGEFAVVVGDVPMGCPAEQAAPHVKLLLSVNDWSLRAFGPREMQRGFGFVQTKPATSFGPAAVTPDEIGPAWRDGRVHLPLHIHWNGAWFGHPNGGAMDFSFYQLIAHAAATRRLRAGAIIGSGTISNADRSVGSACISERRVLEILARGAAQTEFMKFGDTARLEAFDTEGRSVFGAIEQRVVKNV